MEKKKEINETIEELDIQTSFNEENIKEMFEDVLIENEEEALENGEEN